MIIVPTRVCNTNKCSYCHVLKNDFDIKIFEKFDINNFIEKLHFIAKKSGDYNLRFFGGEPFLKFEIIKKIIKKLNKNKYSFVINTNLSLIKKEYLNFLKKYNVRLIISCNGDLYSHCLTRNIKKDDTLLLYKNIKKIVNNGINYQINIVTTPKIINRLHKNFIFLYKKLGCKTFNLLPVNYNGWNEKGLIEFEKQLNLIKNDIKSDKLKINLINKNVKNSISLFNSEIVIDSDGKVYPSMVIMENFFKGEKEKIEISDFNKDINDIKNDLEYYENENQKIYNIFINKVINREFIDIIKNDNKISEIFSNFLQKI